MKPKGPGRYAVAPSPGRSGCSPYSAWLAAALLTGAPRLANEYADRGLAADVAGLPYLVRDISLPLAVRPSAAEDTSLGAGASSPSTGTRCRSRCPAWSAASGTRPTVGPHGVAASGDFMPFNGDTRPVFGLRAQTGVREAIRMVAGDWPAASGGRPGGRIGIAVSQRTADALSLRARQQPRHRGQRGRPAGSGWCWSGSSSRWTRPHRSGTTCGWPWSRRCRWPTGTGTGRWR